VPPPADPALEPYRRLFGGEVPAVLQVDTAIAVHHAIKVFVDEFKVELVLLDGRDALRILDQVDGKVKGVVVPKEITLTYQKKNLVPAAEFSRAGLPVGFQSHGRNAARGLPLNVAYAVRRGMDPGAALRSLTIDAAKMFHIDDRVGSLEAGKDGDVLIFSGDPFEISSRLLHVFVNGAEVVEEADQ
jgi:imidazolonepropionase-like amidohydrolase